MSPHALLNETNPEFHGLRSFNQVLPYYSMNIKPSYLRKSRFWESRIVKADMTSRIGNFRSGTEMCDNPQQNYIGITHNQTECSKAS
jgi:hypothetical protein